MIRDIATHFYGLRGRISLLVIISVLLLSLFVSLSAGEISRTQITHDRGQALSQLAQQFTQQLDSAMLERWREVQLIASLETVQNLDSSADSKRALFEKMLATYPYYSRIGWANTEGIVQESRRAAQAQSSGRRVPRPY